MRAWIIRRLGGYASIDDALEAIKKNPDGAERRKVLTMAVKRLYNTIGPDDILRRDPASGQFLFMGQPLAKEEMGIIIEQAKAFKESRLWKVLQADLKYNANKRLYMESVDIMGIEAGKLFTYCIDVFNTRLRGLVL